MRTITPVLTVVVALGVTTAVTGCGGNKGTPTAGPATRTIEVTMTDFSFQPAELEVAKGETVTLRFKNKGAVTHEAILGDDAAQMKHHAEMASPTGTADHDSEDRMPMPMSSSMSQSMPMAIGHDDVTVDPGKTAELVQTFTETGPVLIGCHEPGHWEAGMKATITVT